MLLAQPVIMEHERVECTGAGFTVPATTTLPFSAVVGTFADRINILAPRADTSPNGRTQILEAVRTIAGRIDVRDCIGASTGYARCLLHEDSAGWSLAAIALRADQSTPAHDHGGWGGAVTLTGVERDRRFVETRSDSLLFIGERDYPPGASYLFDAVDIHQPVGADPSGVTVSLHFMVHPKEGGSQHVHEHPNETDGGSAERVEPTYL